MNNISISICIPSYNRPKELRRLLESIDTQRHTDNIEIVICEDKAPKREEVRFEVKEYKTQTPYIVNYVENEQNCGYDRNLRNLINNARGEYILFMGDDDLFIPGQLDGFIDFLNQHRSCGYILRSYRNVHKDGSIAEFKYYSGNCVFEASDDTYVSMFDKSVFISGFTIKRKYAKEFDTKQFDGSLLYQLYLLAEVCRRYPSAYYCIPITEAREEDCVPFFGNSDSEKDLYDPGEITVRNSINFMGWYVKIIDFIAEKYHNDTNRRIKHNMSKYSYVFMCVHRKRGIKTFNGYVKNLRQIGFGSSIYFYIYYVGLLFLGERYCTRTISFLKKIIGHRPNL